MPLPVANLTGTVVALGYFGWFDIVGDPVRATTLPGGKTFGASETADADLNGQTFVHVPGDVVGIDPVVHAQQGMNAVDVTLSGILGPDNALLTALGSAANWRGRVARLWHATLDASGVTAVSPYCTGYMVDSRITGAPDGGQQVTLTLENYRVLLTQARNRTYLDQAFYDPGDLSAARARASANGATASGIPSGKGLSTLFGALARQAADKLKSQ